MIDKVRRRELVENVGTLLFLALLIGAVSWQTCHVVMCTLEAGKEFLWCAEGAKVPCHLQARRAGLLSTSTESLNMWFTYTVVSDFLCNMKIDWMSRKILLETLCDRPMRRWCMSEWSCRTPEHVIGYGLQGCKNATYLSSCSEAAFIFLDRFLPDWL